MNQPYNRFIELIDKAEHDCVVFGEFFPALVTYCLFTRSEILGFTFNMIDEDRDGYVSKNDIFKVLMIQWAGQRINPTNITRAIEI